MNSAIGEMLKNHSLRRTQAREEVLGIFIDAEKRAIGQPDLEKRLPDVDRVTLYRILEAFEEKGLIHQVVDGDTATKYALCQTNCTAHAHHDDHAHFHCQDCGATLCLDGKIVASIQTPPGFKVQNTHLILEGLCDKCAIAK